MKKPTTAPVRRLLRVVAIAALLAPSVTVTGCAAAAGRNATAGAVDELRRTLQDLRTEGGKPPLEQAAANATRGTIDELAAPEHREQLGLAVGTATESAIDGALDSLERRGAWGGGPPSSYGTPVGSFGGDFSAGLALGLSRQLELGADGSGPLAKSLAGLAQEMSGAAANGVVTEFSPVAGDCTGPDRNACVDRRVYDVSRLAAVGVADGIAHAFRVPILVPTFLGGFLGALVLTAAFRTRARRGARLDHV